FVLPTTTTHRRPIVGCTHPRGGHGDVSRASFAANSSGEERCRSLNQFTARAAHGSRAAWCRICRDASSHRLSAIIKTLHDETLHDGPMLRHASAKKRSRVAHGKPSWAVVQIIAPREQEAAGS